MAKVNELEIVNPSDLPRAESIEGVTLPLVQDGKMVVASAADFLEECKKPVNKFITEKGKEFDRNMEEAKKEAIQSVADGLPIAQETGDSPTKVMSQDAVTKALGKVKVTTDDGKTLQDVYEMAKNVGATETDVFNLVAPTFFAIS